ncbi:MAG: nuclear transport factor 2 family protein [Armatimonadota bacterium]
MKRTTQVLVMWLALMLIVSPISADKRAERQIRAEYAKTVQYMKQKNLEGLLRQMTPDFLYKTPKGEVMNKQMVEMAMREQFRLMRSVQKRTTTIKKMEFKGNTVLVTTEEELAFTFADAQGKPHKAYTKATTRDTWVKTPQGWKVKMTESLSETTYIDGKRQ